MSSQHDLIIRNATLDSNDEQVEVVVEGQRIVAVARERFQQVIDIQLSFSAAGSGPQLTGRGPDVASDGGRDYGLRPGAVANLILLDAGSAVEALRRRPARRYVIRQGQVLLNTETKTEWWIPQPSAHHQPDTKTTARKEG